MGTCSQTNIPVLNTVTEPCDGIYTSTKCIIHESSIIPLGFPQPGASLNDIIVAIVSALNSQNILINNQATQIENLETQIEGLQAQIDACCAALS